MATLSATGPSSLTVTALTTLEELKGIEREWRRLWESDPEASPFQSPEWLIPWTEHVWQGGALRVLVLRDDKHLRGIAPFFLWGYGGKPERITLSFLGSGISDHLGVISNPAFETEVAHAVRNWIAQSAREWDVCDLEELSEGAVFADIGEWTQCSVCPVVSLPDSMAELLALRDAAFRRNLKVATRRLHDTGDLEFVRGNSGNVKELLDHLFRLHTARWNESDEPGVLSSDRIRRFHRDAAQRFAAAGMLRLYGLFVNGECIAVQYNFAAKGCAYFYLSGFDSAWGRMSPGMVLLAHAIEDSIGEEIARIDFLRNQEKFKYHWGARDTYNYRLAIR